LAPAIAVQQPASNNSPMFDDTFGQVTEQQPIIPNASIQQFHPQLQTNATNASLNPFDDDTFGYVPPQQTTNNNDPFADLQIIAPNNHQTQSQLPAKQPAPAADPFADLLGEANFAKKKSSYGSSSNDILF